MAAHGAKEAETIFLCFWSKSIVLKVNGDWLPILLGH